MTGAQLRLRRISKDGRYLLLPIDHGVSVGPIQGLERPAELLRVADAAGTTGAIFHKGLMKAYASAPRRMGSLVHVSSSTDKAPDPNDKRMVANAQEVARMGADGISVHVNLGSLTEPRQIQEFAATVGDAALVGLPVLCMMYPRGPSIPDPFQPRVVAHAARLAEELGADVVKTVYTGDPRSFRDVTGSVSIPVLVAGGPKVDSPDAVLALARGAMQAGAAGVSIGRNVFQHADPGRILRDLHGIIYGRPLEIHPLLETTR